MRNFAAKYRPQSLDSIYGQEKAVAALRRHLESGSNQSVLLVGPSGTGKTTAARIAGASILCEATPPVACGSCTSCKEILLEVRRFTFGWQEFDAARFSDKEQVAGVADILAGDGFRFKWAAFIDEIHGLTGPAADSLLKVVEQPTSKSFCFAATTDLGAVRPALRKRCLIIDFVPLSGANLYALLRDVCGKEEIRFEPLALNMIGSASAGSAREALIKLDQVSLQGDVTAALVADTLSFGSKSHVIGFFDAVLAGDGNAQDEALYNWQAEPVEKAKMIRDYLLHVYNFEVVTPALSQMVNPAFYTVTGSERRRLVEGMRARAGNRPLPDYWLDLLRPWEFAPGTLSDETSLSIKVRRFDRLLNPDGPPAAIVPTTEPGPDKKRVRAYRSRSRKLRISPRDARTLAAETAYLSFAQSEDIYEIASFLPQAYGALFNTRLRLNHGELKRHDEKAAGELVSDLTHEIGARFSKPDPVHWMYVNGKAASGLWTEMVLHIPPNKLADAEEWLRPRIGALCGMNVIDQQALIYDPPRISRARGWDKQRMQRHWWLIRRLVGGLNPTIAFPDGAGNLKSLLDLLKVARSWRGPAGELAELRRYSCSGTLGPGARRTAAADKMKFLSAFVDNAWDRIESGWELSEHRDRQKEVAERQDVIARVMLEWPEGDSMIEADNRAKALAKVRGTWPEDPRKRRRSWSGWWA